MFTSYIKSHSKGSDGTWGRYTDKFENIDLSQIHTQETFVGCKTTLKEKRWSWTVFVYFNTLTPDNTYYPHFFFGDSNFFFNIEAPEGHYNVTCFENYILYFKPRSCPPLSLSLSETLSLSNSQTLSNKIYLSTSGNVNSKISNTRSLFFICYN